MISNKDRFIEENPEETEEELGAKEWDEVVEEKSPVITDKTKTTGNAGKTEMYLCQSYYNDENVLVDCTCGKCETKEEEDTSHQSLMDDRGDDSARYENHMELTNYQSASGDYSLR